MRLDPSLAVDQELVVTVAECSRLGGQPPGLVQVELHSVCACASSQDRFRSHAVENKLEF